MTDEITQDGNTVVVIHKGLFERTVVGLFKVIVSIVTLVVFSVGIAGVGAIIQNERGVPAYVGLQKMVPASIVTCLENPNISRVACINRNGRSERWF